MIFGAALFYAGCAPEPLEFDTTDGGAQLDAESDTTSDVPGGTAFELVVDPVETELHRSAGATLILSLTRSTGFDEAVAITVEDLPPGITAGATSFATSETQALLELSASPIVALGVHQIVIRATAPGATDSAAVKVTVVPELGALDESFGSSGVSKSFVEGFEVADVGTLSDGRIVVMGTASDMESAPPCSVSGERYGAASFTAHGSLDKIWPQTNGGGTYASLRSGTVGGGDTVLGLGKVNKSSKDGFGVARWTPNGEIDPSFGGGLVHVAPQLGAWSGYGGGLSVAADGSVFASGAVIMPYPEPYAGGVIRLTPSGALDPSFSGDGVYYTDTLDPPLALQPDGKLLVVAKDLIRLLASGAPDPELDGDGSVAIGVIPNNDYKGRDVPLLYPDGRILLTGHTWAGTTVDYTRTAVEMRRPDGSLDPSFNSGAPVEIDVLSGDEFRRLTSIQPDGAVLVVVTNGTASNPRVGVALVEPSGTLRQSFGEGGKLVMVPQALPRGATLSDGKLVLASTVLDNVSCTSQIVLARHWL